MLELRTQNTGIRTRTHEHEREHDYEQHRLDQHDQYLNYGQGILEYGHEHTNTNANMITNSTDLIQQRSILKLWTRNTGIRTRTHEHERKHDYRPHSNLEWYARSF